MKEFLIDEMLKSFEENFRDISSHYLSNLSRSATEQIKLTAERRAELFGHLLDERLRYTVKVEDVNVDCPAYAIMYRLIEKLKHKQLIDTHYYALPYAIRNRKLTYKGQEVKFFKALKKCYEKRPDLFEEALDYFGNFERMSTLFFDSVITKGYLVISGNVNDFLFCSGSRFCSFTSCLSPEDGCYSSGSINWYQIEHPLMFIAVYTKNPEPVMPEDTLHKTGRAFLAIGSKSALLMESYTQATFNDYIREFTLETVAKKFLNLDTFYTDDGDIYDYSDLQQGGDETDGFISYIDSRCSLVYPDDTMGAIEDYRLKFRDDNNSYCLVCGNYNIYDLYPISVCCAEKAGSVCDFCGERYGENYIRYVESVDGMVCDNCIDAEFDYCVYCEQYYPTNDGHYIGGDFYCKECFSEVGVECEKCGEYIFSEYSYNTEDGYIVCENCGYVCEYCGNIWYWKDNVEEIDGYYYCTDCADEIRKEASNG